jgi:hypothetical protein
MGGTKGQSTLQENLTPTNGTVALHFAHYNFCQHLSLEAGITDHVSRLNELLS